MPNGYRVTLGDGVLDPGDSITDPLITFVTDTNLGSGQWIWSGTFGGTTFTNETEPGTYFLGTDGYVYFVPSFGPVTTITSSSVVSAPSFSDTVTDNTVDGTGTAETIDDTFTDADGDQVDDGTGAGPGGYGDTVLAGAGNDTVRSGLGDDSVEGAAGADSIEGGAGSDTLLGGAGNDTIHGDNSDGSTSTVEETLDWTTQGGNGANVAGGFVQSTGLMDVTVSFTNDGNNNPTFTVTTDAIFVDTGEPYDGNSSLELFGNGDGATSTTTISFGATTPGAAEDEVQNVRFRISDIDFFAGNHQDIITINAFDANGDPVTVTITPDGDDTVVGNTITAGPSLDNPDDALGSALIEIAGPVQEIEIVYSNGLGVTQAINVSDVYFDVVPAVSANDSIDGGEGADELYGNEGDDTILGGTGNDSLFGGEGADSLLGEVGADQLTVGGGDTAEGGDGDDLFLISADELNGTGITIIGGETGETLGDTLDLTGVLDPGSIVYTNTNDTLGGLSGTATLTDGTILTFSEIETIICFSEGTLIQTPQGERRIETLAPGDLVVTLDNGPQPIRWIGKKTVRGTGALAPIRFARGVTGNHRDLMVSPQHRMLVQGYRAQLLFGETEVLVPAKSLVNDFNVTTHYGGMVTYVHMLFDRHEMVIANGAPSESFYPGEQGLETLTDPAREELFRLFPELRSDVGSFGPMSRTCIKGAEARALAMM